MPAPSPTVAVRAAALLCALGSDLRAQRKRLRLSATALAEAADISRVTLHRIERGEASVTIGAYFNVAAALGLLTGIVPPEAPALAAVPAVPARIVLAQYPQLRQLAWHVAAGETLSPREALDLYERNARHLDAAALQPNERALLKALRAGPTAAADV